MSTSERERMRKPLSRELRIAEVGDMVSVGEERSGESVLLWREVCEVASASREEEACLLVWMRRGCGCDMEGEDEMPVTEGGEV